MSLKSFTRTLFFFPALAAMLFTSVASHAKAIEGVVNINTASVAELTLLPGVGKAKAEQIVQMRQSKPFASIDDLKNVPGLGAKRIEAMRSHVVLDGPTTAKKIAPAKPAGGEKAPVPTAPVS